MKNKKTLIIQIIAVVLLIALGYAMTIIGRGHTVYLDAKKIEVDGTELKPPYKTEVYVNGERIAKLYDKERGMSTLSLIHILEIMAASTRPGIPQICQSATKIRPISPAIAPRVMPKFRPIPAMMGISRLRIRKALRPRRVMISLSR